MNRVDGATLTLSYTHQPTAEVEWQGVDSIATDSLGKTSSSEDAVARLSNNFKQGYRVELNYQPEDDGASIAPITVSTTDSRGHKNLSNLTTNTEKPLVLEFPKRDSSPNAVQQDGEIRFRTIGSTDSNKGVMTMVVAPD